MNRRRYQAAALLGAVSAATPALAVVRTWDRGAATSNWSDIANWNPNGEPTLADDVVLPTMIPGGITTLSLASGETALRITFGNSYSLSGGTLSLGLPGTLRVEDGWTGTVASAITGSSGLNKQGTGLLVLSGVNTFSGPIGHNGGTLRISADAHLGNPGNFFYGLGIGSTLEVAGSFTTSREIRLNSSSFDPAPAKIKISDQTLTMAGVISGGSGHGLHKIGAGTLLLTNANNTYAVGTTINDGTIAMSADRLGSAGTTLTINNAATLTSTASFTIARPLVVGGLGGGVLNVATGTTLTASSPISGTGGLTKRGTGTLAVRSTEYIALNILGGRVVMEDRSVTSAHPVMRLSSLGIAPSLTLDLNDNDLVVNNGSFSEIRAWVIQGFGATTGITSSTSDGSQILALFDNALVGASDWNGSAIGGNAVVGKYTYFGDVNIDGQVTGDDYTVVDANLNTTPQVGLGWLSGDMNLDGIVTGDDYTVIDANLGRGVGNPLTAAAVPEPTIIASLSAGAIWMLRRRKTKI